MIYDVWYAFVAYTVLINCYYENKHKACFK